MPRVTIKEIARRAGVSKGAVSYALNGQPGVSDATRARVLKVAEELEWVPNRAARMLSAARSETFGLVLARSAKTLSEEPFYMGFIGGVESVLSGKGYALTIQVVPDLETEMAAYRKWAAERRVDAVMVVDLRVDDPRVPLLRKLDLPAVMVGHPSHAGGLTSVWTDSTTAMTAAVGHVAALGHVRIARIAGPPAHGHVSIRDEAFRATADRLGLSARIVHTDFSADEGATATRELMAAAGVRPTAIIYDNDLMAVAGLGVLNELGIEVAGRPHHRRLGRLDPVPHHPPDPDRDEPRHRRLRQPRRPPPLRPPRRRRTRSPPQLHPHPPGPSQLRPPTGLTRLPTNC